MRTATALVMMLLAVCAACGSGTDADELQGAPVQHAEVSDVTLEAAVVGDGDVGELELTVRNHREEGIAVPELSDATLHLDRTPEQLTVTARVPRTEPLEDGAVRDAPPTVRGVGIPAGGRWGGTTSIDLPVTEGQAVRVCLEVLPLPGLGPEVLELPIEQPAADAATELVCADAGG